MQKEAFTRDRFWDIKEKQSVSFSAMLKLFSVYEKTIIEILFRYPYAVSTQQVREAMKYYLQESESVNRGREFPKRPLNAHFPAILPGLPSYETVEKILIELKDSGFVLFRETPMEKTKGLWALNPALYDGLKKENYLG